MTSARPLIRNVRAALRELADPEKAPIIQAYMKSAMPCLGIQLLRRRAAAARTWDFEVVGETLGETSAETPSSYRAWLPPIADLDPRPLERRIVAAGISG